MNENIKLYEYIIKKKIININDISIGYDQKVFLLETKEEKYIMKKSKNSPSKIENEEFALNLLSNLNIPIPKLIFKNSDFLIESYIEGNLLSKDHSDNYFIELGYYISLIHSIKLEGFGEIKNGKGEYNSEYDYLFSWLDLNKNSKFDILKKYNVEEILNNNKYLFNNQNSFFLHGDISYSNIIVNNKKINEIIDFGDSISGSIEYDLALFYIKIKNESNWDSFIKGYNKDYNLKKFHIYVIAFGIWLIQDKFIKENDIEYKKFIQSILYFL